MNEKVPRYYKLVLCMYITYNFIMPITIICMSAYKPEHIGVLSVINILASLALVGYGIFSLRTGFKKVGLSAIAAAIVPLSFIACQEVVMYYTVY